jgi:hypothetical protein
LSIEKLDKAIFFDRKSGISPAVGKNTYFDKDRGLLESKDFRQHRKAAGNGFVI